jgi:hypothetical protein
MDIYKFHPLLTPARKEKNETNNNTKFAEWSKGDILSA